MNFWVVFGLFCGIFSMFLQDFSVCLFFFLDFLFLAKGFLRDLGNMIYVF